MDAFFRAPVQPPVFRVSSDSVIARTKEKYAMSITNREWVIICPVSLRASIFSAASFAGLGDGCAEV